VSDVLRIKFANFLIQLGAFFQSLPLVIMRPNDLVEFSRRSYARPHDIEGWSEASLVDSGLSTDEVDMLSIVPKKAGDLLMLGVGGGREAISLAKMGYMVTGVDYVPAMVERAKENAVHRGTQLEGLVQDISQLNVPSNSYDIVWLSSAMYSCVPTRHRRVEMVKRIASTLRPGGFFLCRFHFDPRQQLSKKGEFLRRLIAICTLGNTAYQAGDILWGNIEFIHAFTTEEEVQSELTEGDLRVIHLQTDPASIRGWAICQKILV